MLKTVHAAVAMFLLFIQALAMGFFPGADRGFNLPLGVVSFNSWSYKGLLRNEFAYRKDTGWGCPTDSRVPQLQVSFLIPASCRLDSSKQTRDGAFQPYAPASADSWRPCRRGPAR